MGGGGGLGQQSSLCVIFRSWETNNKSWITCHSLPTSSPLISHSNMHPAFQQTLCEIPRNLKNLNSFCRILRLNSKFRLSALKELFLSNFVKFHVKAKETSTTTTHTNLLKCQLGTNFHLNLGTKSCNKVRIVKSIILIRRKLSLVLQFYFSPNMENCQNKWNVFIQFWEAEKESGLR